MVLHGERGQSTLEMALCLPVLAAVLAAFIEVGLLVGDQVRLEQAAREAARAGVVTSSEVAMRKAAEATGLAPLEVAVTPTTENRGPGMPLTVTVVYRPDGHVPLIGSVLARSAMTAEATMRIEQP